MEDADADSRWPDGAEAVWLSFMKTKKAKQVLKRRREAAGEPVRGLENEAVIEVPGVVQHRAGVFGGLYCHVCRNKDWRCPVCGGPGTPWLI